MFTEDDVKRYATYITRDPDAAHLAATRAVLGGLKQDGRLVPPGGRMMRLLSGGNGCPTRAMVTLDGGREIFRFMVGELVRQCDIAAAARAVLVDLRDHMTPEVFDPMARELLGGQYEKFHTRFERDFTCAGCEKDIRQGWRYAPTDDGGAVCAACCRGCPDYVASLVRRPAVRDNG